MMKVFSIIMNGVVATRLDRIATNEAEAKVSYLKRRGLPVTEENLGQLTATEHASEGYCVACNALFCTRSM